MATTRRHLLTSLLGLPLIACTNLLGTDRPEPNPTSAWFDAIRRGDLAAISQALAQTPSLLDARDERGASALTVALLAEQAATAELLRTRGYLPDVVESAWLGDWERFEALAREQPAAVLARHPLGGP